MFPFSRSKDGRISSDYLPLGGHTRQKPRFPSNRALLLVAVAFFGTFWLSGRFSFLRALMGIGPPIYTYDPYPGKPHITFRQDGTFTLTVFSDLHFGENPWDDWGPEQDRKSLIVMTNMLSVEKPDFVVMNGDLITGENTFRENSTTLIDEIVGPLNQAKVPFASTHGNHDNQVNITHLEEIERENLVAPLSYTRRAPAGVGGAGGEGNYWVPVYPSATDVFPSLVMWFFDSRSGFSPGANSVPLEDWVDDTVATWIETETLMMEAAWGPSENRAAIAFVHIPLHEMEDLQHNLDSSKDPGLNADPLGDGSVQSSVDTSTWGQGRDQPFWKALTTNVPNLHAVVSGHAHGNEWCSREPTIGQVLCFNKHTGYGGYGQAEWGHGVRTFLFDQQSLVQSVQTWITFENGTRMHEVTLDLSKVNLSTKP